MNVKTFAYAIASLKLHSIREAGFPSKIEGIPVKLFDEAAYEFKRDLPNHIRIGLNERFEHGLTLAKKGAVTAWKGEPHPQYHRLFKVASSDPFHPPYFYKVDIDAEICDCLDYSNGNYCQHLVAAHIRYEVFHMACSLILRSIKDM